MKKIAYVELDTHADIASTFMDVIEGSTIFKTDFYFSRRVIKLIDSQDGRFYPSSPETIFSQLLKENYDLVILGTVHRYFDTFNEISEHFPTAIIVHNLHFSTTSKMTLFRKAFSGENFIFRMKLLLGEGLLSAPDLYKKSDKQFVLDQKFVSQQQFQFLPLFYSKYKHHNESDEVLKIVVPGTVSQNRRDYAHILDKLKTFKGETEIVFLGKASGKELQWIENASKAKEYSNISFSFFTEKVPSSLFSEKMKKADVLWCPVQKDTSFFGIPEIYGESKISGNLNDAIAYSKVAIFPKEYAISEKETFIVTESENVEEQMLKIKNDSTSNLPIMEKEKVREQLEDCLLRVV